jgi:anti-sigma B factor antagonist
VTSPGDFELRTAELPRGGVVVEIAGELDMATAPQLEECLEGAGFAQRLVVDLTECTFLDSSAVRVLVAAARDAEAAGGTLALVATDAGIRRVLDISGVDTIVPVHDALDAVP